MRKIKFRAWLKSKNRFIDTFSVDFYDEKALGIIYVDRDKIMLVPYGQFVLEQYTGLKDKNDKEIYEGDLVSCGTIDGNPVGLVGFNTKFGCWEVQDPNHTFGGEHFSEIYCREMEVVGNIHESPELLEEQ